MIERLDFNDPTPVVILAGATKSERSVQTMAGICRGSANSKSIILDSGMGSNIEKFCVRRGVKLIGVCPEDCISYPKILKKQKDELANGHTHFVLIGNKGDNTKKAKKFVWGDESTLKYDLGRRIAAGR